MDNAGQQKTLADMAREDARNYEGLADVARAVARNVKGSKVGRAFGGVKFSHYGGEITFRPSFALFIFTKARIKAISGNGGFALNCIPTMVNGKIDPDYHLEPISSGAGPVFRSLKDLPEGALRDFIAKNETLLANLKLTGNENLEYSSNCLLLRSFTTEPAILIERANVLLDFLNQNALPTPLVRAYSTSFCNLKVGRKLSSAEVSTAKNRIGGPSPRGAHCCTCKDQAHLMALIDLNDVGMSKDELVRLGSERMEIYWCLKCLSDGPVFFDFGAGEFRILDDKGEMGPVGNPHSIRPPDREPRSLVLTPFDNGGRPSRSNRVGGLPSWIQDPEVPECIRCGQGMEFLLQLFSDRKFCYGADMGTLYTFVCPSCRVGCNLIQSH